jgi:hypothetical protein
LSLPLPAPSKQTQRAKAGGCRTSSIRLPCVYDFFLAVVVIRYETTATARWALLFIVRAFFNDTITVAVWTGFHVRPSWGCYHTPAIILAASLIFSARPPFSAALPLTAPDRRRKFRVIEGGKTD